jgi:hypothetical protein
MVLMDFDPEDAARIRAGEAPAEVLKGKSVRNVAVLCLDPNSVIHGPARLKHHLKSLTTLEGAFLDVIRRLKFTIKGNIFVLVEDDFAEPPGMLLKDEAAEVERPKSGGKPSGHPSQRFSISGVLAPRFASDGSLADFEKVQDSVSERFIRSMKAADRQVVLDELEAVIKRLRKSLATVLRNA